MIKKAESQGPSLAISALHDACFKHDNRQAPNSQTRLKRVIIKQGCDERSSNYAVIVSGGPRQKASGSTFVT